MHLTFYKGKHDAGQSIILIYTNGLDMSLNALVLFDHKPWKQKHFLCRLEFRMTQGPK
jgi:hypothetical protein